MILIGKHVLRIRFYWYKMREILGGGFIGFVAYKRTIHGKRLCRFIRGEYCG